MKLILGSSSVNRRAVFRQLFPDYYVDDVTNFLSPDIDEKAIRSENPREMVKLIADAKADKNIQIIQSSSSSSSSTSVESEEIVVIASDNPKKSSSLLRIRSSFVTDKSEKNPKMLPKLENSSVLI